MAVTLVKTLADIPLFSGLSDTAKAEVCATAELREYLPGDVVIQSGDIGQFFYAVAAGAVSVRSASDHQRRLTVLLGPGEVFGEMSLLSESPVSASVIAERRSHIYVIAGRTFARLFAEEPSFQKGIADLLAERLRRKTSARELSPICAFVALPSSTHPALTRALVRGVGHYASVIDKASTRQFDAPTAESLAPQIDAWRAGARAGDVCVVAFPWSDIRELRAAARHGDAVLWVDDGSLPPDSVLSGCWEACDTAKVRIGAASRQAPRDDEPWSFRLDDDEIAEAAGEAKWDRRSTPVLDGIVRWITRRAVGVALGAGAARGFAHIGVLKAFETAGIPIDCLSGSSIGGIVALLYSMSGSADGAYELARASIGSNDLIRDVSLFPRMALFRGQKVRRNAKLISDGKHFGELTRPVSAVASDLLTGDRVVLDRGPVDSALVATAAIPGILPPFESDGRWMVDGGLVSRIPTDLLDRKRCGLKIAVDVIPDPRAEGPAVTTDLLRTMSGPLGLANVIARSWDLLGYWHGVANAQGADLVVRPQTSALSGYDFGGIDGMVTAGRAAGEDALPTVMRAVDDLLRARDRSGGLALSRPPLPGAEVRQA